MTNRKKNAFTLIELLVVIAIIALLLSILMPALKKVKYIARRLLCTANIKSQVLSQKVYAADNDGKFHKHNNYAPEYVKHGANNLDSLYEAMLPYIGDFKVMGCPITMGAPLKISLYDYTADASGSWGQWGSADERNGDVDFIISTYCWFANFTGYAGSNPDGQTGIVPTFASSSVMPDPVLNLPLQGRPWPKNDTEASSNHAMVAHRVSWGNGALVDHTHGGQGIELSPLTTTFSSGVDNPVGYGDGSVGVTLKRDMKPRAFESIFSYYYYY